MDNLPRLLSVTLVVVVTLAGCRSGSPQGDASVTHQDRKEYVRKKYADPATGVIPDGIVGRSLDFARTLPGSRTRQMKGLDDVQADNVLARGPWNVGGRTRALALDLGDERIMFAAGVSGGLWRSTNSGITWTKITPSDELHSATALAQDPRPGQHNVWYLASGESYGNSAQISGNGIRKSTDGGITWTTLSSTVVPSINAGHAFAYAWRIIVSPTTGAVFVATTRNGIFRSTDGGSTWTNVFGTDSFFADIVVSADGRLTAALSAFTGVQNGTARRSGIFESTDNGTTWSNISPPNLPANVKRIVLALVPQQESDVMAIAETPGVGTLGVFRLRDGTREEWHSLWKRTNGQWQDRSAGIPLFGGRSGDFFSQGGYDLVVKVHPTDSNVVVIGGTNLYRSSDAFRTNQQLTWIGGYGPPSPGEVFPSYPNHHPDQHDVIFLPSDPDVMLSANDGGVMRTEDIRANNIVWTDLNRGYLTTQHYAIAIVDSPGDSRVMGGMQDNGTWEGTSFVTSDFWQRRGGGDGAYCFYADSGRTLFVSTQQARIRRVLVDENGIETARTRIDPVGGKDYLFINPYTVDPKDERVVYLAGGRIVWRNNDVSSVPLGRDDSTSVGWDSLQSTRLESGEISAIVATATQRRSLLYGTSTGRIFRLDNAHQGLPVPQEITGVDMPKGAYLNCISVDPSDTNTILVCFSNYNTQSIFATDDGGETWSAVSGTLEELPNGGGNGPAVNWVNILPLSNGAKIYLAATSTGMYVTGELNGMSTVWTQYAAETIGNVPCDMVLVRPSDSLVAVGTHGVGVYTGTVTAAPNRPAAPILLTPADLSKHIGTETLLRWRPAAGAVLHNVEISTTPDFTADVQTVEGIRGDSLRVTDLIQGPVTYWWRVTSVGGGGRGPSSESFTFSTHVRPPALLQPEQNATNVPGNPVSFVWSKVDGATSYDVEVATTVAFTNIVASAQNVMDTTADLSPLLSERRHFWRVRSREGDTAGVWSDRRSFTTATLVGVYDLVESSISVSPNPANDRLLLTIGRQLSLPLTIVITQSDGRTVGRWTVTEPVLPLDLKQWAPGSYTITNARTATKLGNFSIVR